MIHRKAIAKAICTTYWQGDLDRLSSLAGSRSNWALSGVVFGSAGVVLLAIIRRVTSGGPAALLPILFLIISGISLLISLVSHARYVRFQPDVIVDGVHVGLLPLKMVKGSLGEYVCDLSGVVDSVPVTYPRVDVTQKLRSIRDLHSRLASHIPPLLSDEHQELIQIRTEIGTGDQSLFGTEAALHGNQEAFAALLADQKSEADELPVIDLNSAEREMMIQASIASGNEWLKTRKLVLAGAQSLESIEQAISRLEGEMAEMTSETSKHTQIQDFLRTFLSQVDSDVSRLRQAHERSLDGILASFAKDLERMSVRFSIVCYCPECNSELIGCLAEDTWQTPAGKQAPRLDPSTKMQHLQGTNNWECPVCHHQTEKPFVVHRILDELIHPVMDRLLQENAVERLRFYQAAEDAKRRITSDAEQEMRTVVRASEGEARSTQTRMRQIGMELSEIQHTASLLYRELQQLKELENSHLSRIAGDVAQQSKEISKRTGKALDAYHRSCAASSARLDHEMQRIGAAARLEDQARMATLQEIAAHQRQQIVVTKSLAEQTAAVGKRISQGNDRLKENNVLLGSIARTQGAFKPSFPNVPGMISEGMGNMRQRVLGLSNVQRERQRQ